MDNKLVKEYTINLSVCGADGRLSLTGALNLFMDMASAHEEQQGIGINGMEKDGCYWIVGKNRVVFFDRPRLMDEVTISTWYTQPTRLFILRKCMIEAKGRILAIGECEWLVASEGCKKIIPVKDFLNPEYVPCGEELFVENAKRVERDFREDEFIGTYTVSPEDIDYIGHMNNTAYSRALMAFEPVKERLDHPVREAQIFYSLQCHEGDVLKLYRREKTENKEFDMLSPELAGMLPERAETVTETGAFLEDGRCVMTARLFK